MNFYTGTLKGLATFWQMTEVLTFMVVLHPVTSHSLTQPLHTALGYKPMSLTLEDGRKTPTVRSETNHPFLLEGWKAIADCPEGAPRKCTTGGSR